MFFIDFTPKVEYYCYFMAFFLLFVYDDSRLFVFLLTMMVKAFGFLSLKNWKGDYKTKTFYYLCSHLYFENDNSNGFIKNTQD